MAGGIGDAYDFVDSLLGGRLPGGVTGSINTAAPSTASSSGAGARAGTVAGLPALTVTPSSKVGLTVPRGYVIVEVDGRKVGMLAKVAYAMGLKKRPQRGGGITRREVQAARKVQGFLQALTVNRQPRMKIKGGKRGRR